MGNEGSKVDEKALSKESQLSVEEVHALLKAFEKQGIKKGTPVELDEFLKVVAQVHAIFPKTKAFEKECAVLAFGIFDTNHDSTVDIHEFLAGISTFTKGSLSDKASLVFRSLDADNDGILNEKEIHDYAHRIVAIAEKLSADSINSEYGGSKILNTAFNNILSGARDRNLQTIVNAAFVSDGNMDGKITLAEWISAASSKPGIQALIDPFVGVHLYDWLAKEFTNQGGHVENAQVKL